MRVFYVIKALQIFVAFVLIVRLLFVTNLCESREITTRSGCSGAVKLAIPPLNTDLNLLDAERSVMTATLLRPRRMNVILTKKDLSLEELHDEGHKRRKGQLNEAEAPKEQKDAVVGTTVRADIVSKVTESSARVQTSSPIIAADATIAATKKTDTLKDLKKEFETMAKEHIGKREVKPNQVLTEERVKEEKDAEEKVEKADEESSNVGKNEKVQNKVSVVKKEEITEKKIASDKKEEKPGQLDSSAMNEEKLEEKSSNTKNEPRKTVQNDGNDKKEEKFEKMHSDAKILPEQEKNLGKEVTVMKAENVTNVLITKLPAIRLRNTVVNCMETDSQDMLGFGDIDLSSNVALRLPITCLILSILGGAASVAHTYTNLSRPRKCRTLIENLLQIVLWAIAGFVLFVVRHEWDENWNSTSNGTFLPDYPFAWYYGELICYAMIIIFLAEIYLYDYVFYKIYIEESLGNYSVVEPPEYGNSIYGTTVEITEDNQL